MLAILSLTVLAVSAILQGGTAAPQEDLVTFLPGLSKQPPFKHYSGYLKGDTVGDKHLHYWFVESSSNPRSDPVVVWLNGGPGCSSLIGFLYENGPFEIHADGETLSYNPYSWNQAANMIYLESPVGVGFSYSDSGKYKTNDTAVAIENMYAVKSFFEKFPEYKANDFYITGESYGGIYIPTLVSNLLDDKTTNLKGFAIGNPLLNYKDNDNSLFYYGYYHGLIGETKWNFLLDNCCPSYGHDKCDFVKASKTNSTCKNALNEASNQIQVSGFQYNMYAGCPPASSSSAREETSRDFITSYANWQSPLNFVKKARTEKQQTPNTIAASDPDSRTCINMAYGAKYLNSPAVRKAIHISPKALAWQGCSSTLEYKSIYQTVSPFFKKALSRKLRMMVYNGDVDMVCNFLGDEWFVERLPLKNAGPRKLWHYMRSDGARMPGGYVKTFDFMSLVTVKGSGHLVPANKPEAALEMFVNYVQNKPFKV